MSAEIPRALVEQRPEEAVRRMNWYYDVFGPERFFVELQHHNIKEITDLNRSLVEIGARYSAKFVATNDVHYINPEDARLQDILLAIQTQTLLSDPSRMRMTDDSYYLRTPREMGSLFAEVPEALGNTLLIAERCNVDLSFKGYHLPEFPVPEGYTAETYLRHLCDDGAVKSVRRTSLEPGGPGKAGLRARRRAQDGLRRLLPDRFRPVSACPREEHLVQRARIRGGLHHRVRAADHAGRSFEARSAVRTIPESRSDLDARHRPGLSGRPPQPDA